MSVELSARFSDSNTGEIHANRQELLPCMKRVSWEWENIKTRSTILQKKYVYIYLYILSIIIL